MVTHEQVERRLHSMGLPMENMFLITEESENDGIMVLWYPEIGARELLIENDELAMACYAYLLNHGARKFVSWEDFGRALAAEKWPGWDTCEPSAQGGRKAENQPDGDIPRADPWGGQTHGDIPRIGR